MLISSQSALTPGLCKGCQLWYHFFCWCGVFERHLNYRNYPSQSKDFITTMLCVSSTSYQFKRAVWAWLLTRWLECLSRGGLSSSLTLAIWVLGDRNEVFRVDVYNSCLVISPSNKDGILDCSRHWGVQKCFVF